MRPIRLALIGAGPSCTYVLERLAATVNAVHDPFMLELDIFDKTGEFGAGQVHSTLQPSTSFLNRIAGQVAFGADESVVGAGPLLPKSLRPTLFEWCRTKFAETGHTDFDLTPEDWPKRYVHGLALRDMFRRYSEILCRNPSVRIYVHHCEVVDLREAREGFELMTLPVGEARCPVDHVLFLTGHSYKDPQQSPVFRRWLDFGKRHPTAYVPNAYPLEKMIPDEAVTPMKIVGCAGMGLTAIDVILYLTEGRNGRFEVDLNKRLVYKASGAEPASIVAFGTTGLFTFARPYNAKEKDPKRLEHKGVFLTNEAIDRLRLSVGVPMDISQVGVQRQLDFEQHVFPLVLLEMEYLYYKTLFGDDFAQFLIKRITPHYESFLENGGGASEPTQINASLLAPVDSAVEETVAVIDSVLTGRVAWMEAMATAQPWSLDLAFKQYIHTVFEPTGGEKIRACLNVPDQVRLVMEGLVSPWGHASLASDNRFSWVRLIDPIHAENCASPHRYRNAMLAFMERDHLWASQNNVDNPAKAAADGVWRDLRQVLAYAVDFGGLRASSHRKFLSTYMRHHNRVANGAALEIMEKMRALVEHGILDVSVGPNPAVSLDEVQCRFRIHGSQTKAERFVDTLIDAKIHAFDPEADVMSLYRNLYSRGLIRKWRNPSHDGLHFEPGGLDLTPDFHSIRADGSVDRRITFLGPPTEGVMFFQLGALRPNQNHHVMQDVLTWVRGFWNDVADHAKRESECDSMISGAALKES